MESPQASQSISAQPWQGDRALGTHPTLGLSERDWLQHVAEERNYTCEVTGQVGGIAVHHLNGVAYFPEQRWDDSNVIVIAKSLHIEFHYRFMGGFRVPCTRSDFERFIEYKKENGGLAAPLRGYEQASEFASREEHIKLYREITGLQSIPADKQYWTPVGWQSERPESQVNHMVSSGLITPAQFHGVSEYAEVIEHNQGLHPDAQWHLGEWENTILLAEDFNPALVYLDSGCLSGRTALSVAAHTMHLCPVGTVLLVNVVQFSYLQETMQPEEFIAELSKRVPDLRNWTQAGKVVNYHYNRGEMLQQTYSFIKQKEDVE
jgi:hypothetical protein